MNVVVIYDSTYGNTAEVARAIGSSISGETRVLRVGEVNPGELNTFDLLIFGSPTQGGRPTKIMQDFIENIPESVLKGKQTAVFDTRLSSKLVGVFGYAAGRMADSLRKKGVPVLFAEGFFVKGKEGGLKEGELARAAGWAKEINKK